MNSISAAARAPLHAASRSQFDFRIQGIPDETFSVKSFTGSHHALSVDYCFTVHLEAQEMVAPEHAAGRKATLALAWSGWPVRVHGLVSEFACTGPSSAAFTYAATLSSPLFPLKLARNNRVFLNTTAPQIIEELLAGAAAEDTGYELRLDADYPLREFVVQYDESDWDFLRRICDRSGIFFRFAADGERTRVLFHDNVEELPPLAGGELPFHQQTGTNRTRETVFAFRPRAALLTGEIELKDYNYRTPEARLAVFGARQGEVGGRGRSYRYGENFKDMEEGQNLARIRQQALDWQRETFVAESDFRGVTPGGRITLLHHPQAELNGDYLVIEVEHEGDQGAGFAYGEMEKGMTYRNRMLLIRAGVPYRRPVPEGRRVHGLFTARIETTGGDYACLDEQGRYRVRPDFDLGDAPAGAASHPVRMVQPHGGDAYGFHFPLHAGTEVVLSCVNGDLDRPVILGALPNPDTPSPVTSGNRSENVLRTWGGNELIMEDRQGKERTELFTRGRRNILTLDADKAGHQVRLASEEGQMELFAARTLLLESGDTHTMQSGNDHVVTIENAQRLMTKNREIEQQAATDIRMKAGENILLQAESEDIAMTCGRDMLVEVGRSMSVEVRSDDLEMLVDQGQLNISVARAITITGQGGGAIHIGQGAGSIEISPEGDVVIDAPSVEINAASINIKGAGIGTN